MLQETWFPPGYKTHNFLPTQIHNLITTDDLSVDDTSKEQDIKDFRLTSQQYQFLSDLLRQNITAATSAQAQINQVGTFSVDTNNNNHQSPIGNFSYFTPTIYNSWIIDSDATDHVCTNLSAFTHYTKITHVLINFPNGQNVFAHYFELVQFSTKFYLLDVLYVPQFKLNLISASKLSLQLKCTLTFNFTHCIIQDHQSHEKKIGIVKAIDGLYLFNAFSVPSHTTPQINIPSINCNIKDTHLWHYRMGYPSHERLIVS